MRKSKKPEVVLKVPEKDTLKFGKLTLVRWGSQMAAQSPHLETKVPNDGLITSVTKKGLIDWVFLEDTGRIAVHAHISLKQLQKFVKKVEANAKRWAKYNESRASKDQVRRSFMHINPEFSFWIDYGTATKPKSTKKKQK
jgi:hypothetical protein